MPVGLMIGVGLALMVSSRLVLPSAATRGQPTPRPRLWRGLPRVLLFSGLLLYLIGVVYGGWTAYLVWRERVSPSTEQVLVLKDGREIPLVQPSAANETLAPGQAGRADSHILPPVAVRIPRIGVEAPVVLSEVDHLPQFRGVGWLNGTAFPGAPGNLVLYGYRDGPYETFARLHELAPGDEVSITTEAGAQRYRVRRTYETTGDDVAVLAPTQEPTATLITASEATGSSSPPTEMFHIVVADYVAP